MTPLQLCLSCANQVYIPNHLLYLTHIQATISPALNYSRARHWTSRDHCYRQEPANMIPTIQSQICSNFLVLPCPFLPAETTICALVLAFSFTLSASHQAGASHVAVHSMACPLPVETVKINSSFKGVVSGSVTLPYLIKTNLRYKSRQLRCCALTKSK